MFIKTTALEKILRMKSRVRVVQGGTSAGKTISILEILIDIAQSSKSKLISVVSETFPHLRKGAIKDFLEIMEAQGYFNPNLWNKTESTYNFESGSKIEFFSADQPGKVRGPRRDILFVNEGNNISYETYTQLSIRTKEFIFIDYNPVSEFWVHTEIIPKTTHDFIILNYLDNEGLSKTIVDAIESMKGNANFWKVYGLGELGEAEGRIYTGWQIIDEIPHEAKLIRYGLDFGYSNDPTASDAIYEYNGGLIIDEVIHQKGLQNSEIAAIYKNMDRALIIADSAEPKSIAELKSYGLNILPAEKGKDSVNNGIQLVQSQKISITKRSVNTIKEYRNYLWLTNKDGKIINEPSPFMNHHMDCLTGETLVDTTNGAIRIKDLVGKEGFLYTKGGLVRRFHDVVQTGKKDIYKVEFLDGRVIKCSAEHPFLLKNGKWKPACLLTASDEIQLVTYESKDSVEQKTGIQREMLLFVWRILSIFWREETPFRCLGFSSFQSKRHARSSCRQKQIEQSNRKSEFSFSRPTLKVTRERTSGGCRNLAWFGQRDKISFKAWQRYVEESDATIKNVLSLWSRIYYSISDKIKLLPSELQNESKTAKIKRITRESNKRTTYNLEVEDTHCFSVNGGIIVHNCIRYAVSSTRRIGWEQPKDVGGVLPYIPNTLV